MPEKKLYLTRNIWECQYSDSMLGVQIAFQRSPLKWAHPPLLHVQEKNY